MKNLVLAVAAVAALWTGSAYAQGSVSDRPLQANEQHGQRFAYATSTRGQFSIYSTFQNDANSQGGKQ